MRSARVEAQAKLNLFLRIVGREPSGYHQLSTLFQRIALADDVTVRLTEHTRSLDCVGANVGPVEENLAWRAALAFSSAARWPGGFAIEVIKRIPVGGGLGGGSADAAAVLRAMNALAPTPLSAASLGEIAFTLGADVPYLLSEDALALGSGRGERLLACDPLPPREILLALPPFGVSSGEAFGWYAAAQGAVPRFSGPVGLGMPLTWPLLAQHAVNDLEEPVFARHPSLARLREVFVASGAQISRMSGSGSTIFAVYGGGERPGADPTFPDPDTRRIWTSSVGTVSQVRIAD
ncbi:MAG: 4-(cytidine 5'-diphospho)-2-C-methyl-D-erythritol kinase [Gemmatimonadetes bacterium]|nr:4-(cytidine 5'-diphospho)-2-C-methyl-D-erythritol kinase [Gemmatimonadota bacterium]